MPLVFMKVYKINLIRNFVRKSDFIFIPATLFRTRSPSHYWLLINDPFWGIVFLRYSIVSQVFRNVITLTFRLTPYNIAKNIILVVMSKKHLN